VQGSTVAVSIPTPTQRFIGREDELSQALLNTVNQVREYLDR
jgi:hypothetical protein